MRIENDKRKTFAKFEENFVELARSSGSNCPDPFPVARGNAGSARYGDCGEHRLFPIIITNANQK